MKKTRENFIMHFKNNIRKYILVSSFLFVGIILGALWGIDSQKSSHNGNILNSFLSVYKLTGITSNEMFLKSMMSNIRPLILLWISGFSIYLIPINLCTCSIKGFGIGYTISYFTSEGGIYGLFFSFINLFFQNIIYIPAMLIYSVIQINYVMNIKKANSIQSGYKQIKKLKINNFVFFIIGIIICVLCAIVETGVVPALIKLIYGNIA